jgi:hypothetical protein
MPTVSERLEVLEPQLEALRRGAEERSLIDALRTRAMQIASKRQALEAQLALLQRVEQLGGKIAVRPRASAPLRGKPAILKSRLEANPADILDNSQWDASFMTPLEALTGKLQEATLESWKALVDETAPMVGDEVLRQFEITGFSRQVREVRAARERIRELRNRPPTSDSALTEVKELSEAAARELGALEAVPSMVRSFINKAAANEASLDDLTNEVRDWLRDRNMLQWVRIGLKT